MAELVYAGLQKDEVTKEEIFSREGEFHKWEHEAFFGTETGYEDVLDEIKEYTAERYEKSTPEEQEQMVEDVFQIYRGRNIFPITYYSELAAEEEVLKTIEYKAEFDGDVVSTGPGIGSGLCNWMFPNLTQEACSVLDAEKEGQDTVWARFFNDKVLRRAIAFSFSYKGGCPVPNTVRSNLMLGGSAPTNFRPANAKAIWERFTPEGGIVYDYCAGFGGRMLGALSSKKNLHYIGVDPNTETMYNLHRLGMLIESVTGRENSYELHCCGAEDFKGIEESVDFAFSSPPYFELEQYCDEPTQCYNKFPELNGWLEGFVRETIRGIYRVLKPGCSYAVNIADFKNSGGEMVNYVDAWKDISEQEGMPWYSNIYLGVNARAGSKRQNKGEKKLENIMVFKKN